MNKDLLIEFAAELLQLGRPAEEAGFALFHAAVCGVEDVLAALVAAGFSKEEAIQAVLEYF